MADVVSHEVRSRMMSGIRGKNTKPEMLIRRALHARGFRYRLHGRKLPGRPDLVFAGRHAVIFIHGCFWHGHDCELFRLPGTRTEFWREKIQGNSERDATTVEKLTKQGWRVLSVWECGFRGRQSIGLDAVVNRIEKWLNSNRSTGEIRGGK